MKIRIAGTGSYLPEKVVTNDDLARELPDTSDEWIVKHTGIKTRHLASAEDSPSGMGLAAARRALDLAGISPKDLGFVLVSSTTTDYAPIPQTSCIIQRELGATGSVAFDLTSACCGFIYNLEIARNLFNNPFHRRPILVIATEMMSRMLDWKDHRTCVLFGDGAGAVVLVPSETESNIEDTYMRTDGTGADYLRIEGGCRTPTSHYDNAPYTLHMQGPKVFQFAIKALPEVYENLLQRNHLTDADLAWIVPHQANYRIIESAARRIKKSLDGFYLNVDRIANTASASIPIALDEMNRGGLLHQGDRIITASFGAGLSYGGNLIVW